VSGDTPYRPGQNSPDGLSGPPARIEGRGLRTGTLLFFILSLVLAPIGIIGVSAALAQLQRSDTERQALLSASTREQAQNLSSRLRSDRILMLETLRRRGNSSVEDRCRLILGLFPGLAGEAPITQVVDAATGAHRCINGVPPDRSAVGRLENARRISAADGTLTQTVRRLDDGSNVEIIYPVAVLTRILGRSQAVDLRRRFIDRGNDSLPLNNTQATGFDAIGLSSSANIGRSSLTLRASTNRTLFDSADAALTLATPVGMWLLALLLCWFIVDRLLLTPVARLGRQLGAYTPGDQLPDHRPGWFQVAEVGTLSALMRGLVDRVAGDKQSLAKSLEHQQNLTREVHHRVKNNLQIIASLINLHGRDSASEDAVGAYRIMQRRVDALAVVYRHLQAEGEEQMGMAANTLLTDLSNGLKQGLAADGNNGTIHIDTVPVRVTQDIALPMAFFVTELAELAYARAPGTTVVISLTLDAGSPRRARLAVTSEALKGSAVFADTRASYHRVLQGLARQLRQQLAVDERGGRYAIEVPTL
jgi:two-component system, sensor histidine kinase PdtaS